MRLASLRTAGAAITLLLATTACGGGDDAGGDGPVKVSLGYFPLVHTATAVYAVENDLFDSDVVDVELAATAGGAQAIPSLVAGEYDITYANYTSAILAAQQGLPLAFVAGNDLGATDHGIFVQEDSDIESVADMKGGSFAVNNLQNIGTVAIGVRLEEEGLSLDDVKLVEMPYPDMGAALDRGDVDAIWQVEPFQAGALASGQRKVDDLFAGEAAELPVAGWVATKQFVQENPEAVAAIQEGLAAAAEELAGDRAALDAIVPTYTKVPEEVAAAVEPPLFQAELDEAALQEVSDLMAEYGIIDEPFDVATMMPRA